MVLSRGFTDEIKMQIADEIIGALQDEQIKATLTKIGKHIDYPLRIFASATPDGLLNIASSVTEAGDTAGKTIPAVDGVIPLPAVAASTINFLTGATTGATITVEGGTFELPTTTIGEFRRFALVLLSDGSIDSIFSDAAATVGALTNPGELFDALGGLPIGFVDLESISTGGGSPALSTFKTAASSTNVIENKVGSDIRVFRFGSGGGGGGGEVTDFKVQKVQTDGTCTIKGGSIIDEEALEYATYDGAGSSIDDFFVDVDIDLDNLVGSPVNDTTYYLYIDRHALAAATALTENDREIFGVTESELAAFSDSPSSGNVNLNRYIPFGFVRYATAQWSSSVFGTLSFRRHFKTDVSINPIAFTATDTVTGHGGATGTITHNKAIPVKDQLWLAFPDDASNEQQFDGSGWVTDKSENAVSYDFSSLALTDTVKVVLIDLGTSAQVVPIKTFRRIFTSNPSLPINTNLVDDPSSIQLWKYDSVNSAWAPINAEGYVSVGDSGTKPLNGDISGLSPSGTEPVKIVLSTATEAVAVEPNAVEYIAVDAAYNAKANDKLLAATEIVGAFTVTLPGSPTQGDEVEVFDANGYFGTNNLTIGRNGNNINGAASDYTMTGSATGAKLVYIDSTQGWRVFLYA